MTVVVLLAALTFQATATQNDPIGAVLTRHCAECHAGEKPKGDFRLDDLKPQLSSHAAEERWQSVLDQLRSGAMPPKKKSRVPEGDLKAVTEGIDRKLSAA